MKTRIIITAICIIALAAIVIATANRFPDVPDNYWHVAANDEPWNKTIDYRKTYFLKIPVY